jgi:hypothetical protein
LTFCAVAFGQLSSSKRFEEYKLTSELKIDNLSKFVQSTAVRPVSKSGLPGHSPSSNSAIKFEDTNLWLCPELVLDPKLSA